jgi:hypothetical protein
VTVRAANARAVRLFGAGALCEVVRRRGGYFREVTLPTPPGKMPSRATYRFPASRSWPQVFRELLRQHAAYGREVAP